MSRWLYEFWNDVADPSWPTVEFWHQFVKVDDKIKQECYQQHRLAERLQELDNTEFWQCKVTYPMYQKDNFVFVNIPKCGSTHYQEFFLDRLGWKIFVPDRYQDLENLTIFGLMMDPHLRYLKGITEFLWMNAGKSLRATYTALLFPDTHSLPVSLVLGPLMDRIAWIPMDNLSDQEVKQCMNNLFKKKKSNLTVPTTHISRHISSPEKRALFEEFKNHFYTYDSKKNMAALIHHILIPDTIFYRDLLSKFTSDWQHLG